MVTWSQVRSSRRTLALAAVLVALAAVLVLVLPFGGKPVTTVVGPDGGIARGPDGVEVEFPRGVVLKNVAFTVARLDRSAKIGVPVGQMCGHAYTISPVTAALHLPVVDTTKNHRQSVVVRVPQSRRCPNAALVVAGSGGANWLAFASSVKDRVRQGYVGALGVFGVTSLSYSPQRDTTVMVGSSLPGAIVDPAGNSVFIASLGLTTLTPEYIAPDSLTSLQTARKTGLGVVITRVDVAGVVDTVRVNIRPNPAAAVLLKAGNNQTGAAQSILADSIRAQVNDAANQPVAGAWVVFTSLVDGRTRVIGAKPTDAKGLVVVPWWLGPQVGQQVLSIRVQGTSLQTQAQANVTAAPVPVVGAMVAKGPVVVAQPAPVQQKAK